MSIDSYIHATRKNFPKRATNSVYRDEIFPLLDIPSAASGLKFCPLIPIVTYSYSRRVECVEFEGQEYLIYDQYMGQTFNVFNRLAFDDGNTEARVIYFMKYAAERLLQLGDERNALILAIIHSNLKRNSTYFSNASPTEERGLSIFVQELYLMAHEIYHSLLKRSNGLSRDSRDHAKEFLEGRLRTPNEENLSSMSSQVDRDFHAVMSVALGFELDIDEELIRELCCDRLALNFCATTVPHLFGQSVLQRVLTSCYTAHLFTRMLTFIDQDLAKFSEGIVDGEGNFDSMLSRDYAVHQARKAYIRQCSFYYAADINQGSEKTGVAGGQAVLSSIDLFKALEEVQSSIQENLSGPLLSINRAFVTGEILDDFSFVGDAVDELRSTRESDLAGLAERLLGW
ncbi:hypothetical protein [Pararhodobacter aggregans]|uniref:hypothetical protein n=1 Tax=Pararhodobacter aggregans TaxID=404875 RepID=UPI000D46DB69|nr:hypothetical protein [Pararhodobacter aggregans]PTW99142.1 hypothetical protein C8N33_11745 [Pararhodobacter aggregans]